MTHEVVEVCHQIRPSLEEKLGSPCATFEPKSFKSQISNILNNLLANFLTLRVWECTGAIQGDKYLKWQ